MLKVCIPSVFFAQVDVEISANFGIMKSEFNKTSIYGTAYSVSPSVGFGGKKALSLLYVHTDMNASSEQVEKVKLQKYSLLYGMRTDTENKKFSFQSSLGPSILIAENNAYSKNVFGIDVNLSISHQLWSIVNVNFGINTNHPFNKELDTLIYPYFGVKLDLFKNRE